MNANEVIAQHRKWKERVLVAMAKHEQMNVAEISADNCCNFGKWLYGEAKDRFSTLASYGDCVAKHAAFHQEAGKVAQKVNDGELLAASQQLITQGTPYHHASEALAISVIAMFKDAEA
jgi:hypothetical protein